MGASIRSPPSGDLQKCAYEIEMKLDVIENAIRHGDSPGFIVSDTLVSFERLATGLSSKNEAGNVSIQEIYGVLLGVASAVVKLQAAAQLHLAGPPGPPKDDTSLHLFAVQAIFYEYLKILDGLAVWSYPDIGFDNGVTTLRLLSPLGILLTTGPDFIDQICDRVAQVGPIEAFKVEATLLLEYLLEAASLLGDFSAKVEGGKLPSSQPRVWRVLSANALCEERLRKFVAAIAKMLKVLSHDDLNVQLDASLWQKFTEMMWRQVQRDQARPRATSWVQLAVDDPHCVATLIRALELLVDDKCALDSRATEQCGLLFAAMSTELNNRPATAQPSAGVALVANAHMHERVTTACAALAQRAINRSVPPFECDGVVMAASTAAAGFAACKILRIQNV